MSFKQTPISWKCHSRLVYKVVARGSGKTVAAVTWVKHMERSGYVTRTFLISPTAETNKVFQNLSTLSEDNICSTPNQFQQALQTVYNRVKQSMKEHKDSLKYKQIFDKYKNNEVLTLLEENILQQRQYSTPEIVPKPRDLLIMNGWCTRSVSYTHLTLPTIYSV